MQELAIAGLAKQLLKGADVEAKYANCFQIGHNALEFFLEFGQMDPAQETGTPHTRVIIVPASAKLLIGALRDALSEYEDEFGPVSGPETTTPRPSWPN